jgi:membrane protease YdiL (CAAX protease family)
VRHAACAPVGVATWAFLVFAILFSSIVIAWGVTLRPMSQRDAIMLAVTVAIVPVIEEFAFRKLLLGWLRKRLSTRCAVVIQAGVFSLLHIQGGTFAGVMMALLAGLVLGALYVAAGALWRCVIMHGSLNTSVVVIGAPFALGDTSPIWSGLDPWVPLIGTGLLLSILIPLTWWAWRAAAETRSGACSHDIHR